MQIFEKIDDLHVPTRFGVVSNLVSGLLLRSDFIDRYSRGVLPSEHEGLCGPYAQCRHYRRGEK